MIKAVKWKQLREKMHVLGIREEDIVEKFIIGAGKGGQKLHKTASCVYLHHQPSGIEIKCQATRSREQNRYYARKRLCEKIDEQQHQRKSERQQAYEKIRRQKRRRSRRAEQKRLGNKLHRSQTKQMRKTPSDDQ